MEAATGQIILIHYLWCWQLIWVLVHVPAAPLLPNCVLGEQWRMVQGCHFRESIWLLTLDRRCSNFSIMYSFQNIKNVLIHKEYAIFITHKYMESTFDMFTLRAMSLSTLHLSLREIFVCVSVMQKKLALTAICNINLQPNVSLTQQNISKRS